MDSAARNGEFTWCVFVWVCYCMSQSGVYATTLLDKPAHRMRSVWDKHNEIIASCDALARTVATTRRGRGKPTAAAAGTTEGRGRGGSRARRGAPARPPGDRAAASGSSDPGSGSSDEGEGGAATPPPDAMESDEHAGIDADARERMWHALFVRGGIDAKLFELVGCPAPSSNWSTSVEHMWLANSGLTQAQNPLLLQIEPHPELQGWLAAETAQPPWRRFSHFHADASREAWERLELSVPQRHPANVRFLRRAVASFELAAWNLGLLTPRPELPTEPDRWTCFHWDAVFLDRFEFHVSRLPGYYVNDRWRASQNTGPGLDIVEPVPAHARWLMSCWFSGRTGPGTVPFVPYSEQQLPEEVRFFYGRVRALHPGCEGLVCELASMYPPDLNISEVVQRAAAKTDADSWLSQEVRLYDNTVEGASWTLGEIDFPVEGAEVVIRSLPFVRWIDDWAGAVRANERDAAGDTPMVEATAAASATSAAAAGPSEPPAPDPQAPPGSRTWYDGTLERLRYCEKYCVLLPDPLGAGSATNTLPEQQPWGAIPRLRTLMYGENGPRDCGPVFNPGTKLQTRFHPDALDADAALHSLASTVLGNVEGHNRGIPAAILLYGPPVPPTPTTLEGADVQGLPYVLAMMGLDEHITKWVSSEPALPLREDGPITKAYATLNTVMHHTCRMSYAYLHRPHQFNPHAGPNRAPPRSRVVAFKDPRFGRKFGIRVVAQADSRVRMLVPGEPVLSSERAFAAELDANALDVLGDAAGKNAIRVTLGPAHVAMQYPSEAEARRQLDRLPPRVFTLGRR
eukprot:tig00000473_g1216.t1